MTIFLRSGIDKNSVGPTEFNGIGYFLKNIWILDTFEFSQVFGINRIFKYLLGCFTIGNSPQFGYDVDTVFMRSHALSPFLNFSNVDFSLSLIRQMVKTGLKRGP